MKICFVSPFSSRGGAELSLIELIDALRPHGFECSCIIRGHGMVADLLADRGVEPIVVPFKPWVHTRKSLLKRMGKMLPHRQIVSTARLVSAIKRSGCDLVYTNSVAAGAVAVAAKIAGVPHILHLREFGQDDYGLAYDLGQRFSTFLMRKFSTTFVANSKAVSRAYCDQLGQTEMNVVYNSVELPNSMDISLAEEANAQWRQEGAIRCILAGKLLRGKGQEEAVRAMLHLRQMNVPAELILVGGTLDHSYFNQITDMIEQHNLADRVRIQGHSDNPIPLMNSADLVLMCSRREAFGRVTVEGMKLGKPVIGTRCGGTPEILDDRRTGMLYEQGNSQDLAAKIAHLHFNVAERIRIGQAAQKHAKARFNQDVYGANIAKVIHRATSGSRGPVVAPATRSTREHVQPPGMRVAS